eukprot:5487500-Lingulodinium_polyedra.AAC.1
MESIAGCSFAFSADAYVHSTVEPAIQSVRAVNPNSGPLCNKSTLQPIVQPGQTRTRCTIVGYKRT